MPIDTLLPAPTPSGHREFDVDYKAIFPLHAKLHCLVKRYEITSLEERTLHKLHETLKDCTTTKFVSREGHVADIVTLANYVYTRHHAYLHPLELTNRGKRSSMLRSPVVGVEIWCTLALRSPYVFQP